MPQMDCIVTAHTDDPRKELAEREGEREKDKGERETSIRRDMCQMLCVWCGVCVA